VTDSGHRAPVGINVGRGNIAFAAQQREDHGGVAAREAFAFGLGQCARIAPHATFGAAEGKVGDGALERHQHRQRPNLVEVHQRVKADAAFARPAR